MVLWRFFLSHWCIMINHKVINLKEIVPHSGQISMDVLARYVIEMNGSMEQINAHLP